MIFVNRISGKNPGLKLGSRDTYVKLFKIALPLNDFMVTTLDFSDCDGFV